MSGEMCAPQTRDGLREWIKNTLGLDIPNTSVCPHHDSPLEYLWSAFNDAADMVVWAPRGGGKTTLGAVATLLDLVFKPGCQVRILGGSLQQSLKMWEQLLPMLEQVVPDEMGKGSHAMRLRLENGSSAAVLTQSQRSVRGNRVQRIRCDEVELFDRDVWEAAQLVTRSLTDEEACRLGGETAKAIKASIEALSTLHEPYGLMQEVVDVAASAGRKIVRWCLLDVLEHCPPERNCETCELHPECKGAARNAAGFFRIDDAIAMKKRVSRETWEAEMLCLRPSRRDTVFRYFKAQTHVAPTDWWNGNDAGIQRTLAIDFGYRHPFVCLWILNDTAGRTFVLDELVSTRENLATNIMLIQQRGREGFRKVSCDPAGRQTNSQTSKSDVQVLRASGFEVRERPTQVLDGVDAISTALAPAVGEPTLRIHPRCKNLIRSMECYHYDKNGSEKPCKDHINDHAVDALRYYYVNRPGPTWSLTY